MKFNRYKLSFLVLGFGLALTSCKEEIDTSNRYTFTGETVSDYISNRAEFSEFYRMMNNVPLSDFSKSSVAQLLSARGNYVVFAPTNDAIARYLRDSVAVKELIPAGTTSTTQIEDKHVADSLERIIVYNSVINRGDSEKNFWFINDMCRDRYSELPTANMNGRYLTVENPTFELVCKHCNTDVTSATETCPNCQQTLTADDKVETEKCRVSSGDMRWNVRNRDVEVFNGVVQEMNDVVAPSNDNIFQILNVKNGQFTTWAGLLQKTGIDKLLTDPNTAFEDYEYKKMYEQGVANFSGATDRGGFYTQKGVGTEGSESILPERREYGFTIFAETNATLAGIGVNGADDASLQALKDYLVAKGADAIADELKMPVTTDDNYSSEENIVHQWLLYHILPMRLTYDALVVHWNEQGFNPKAQGVKKATVPVSEYYQTMGKPYRLLKLTDGRNTGGVCLNRFWKNKSDAKGIDDFEGVVSNPGILVSQTNSEALNGLIYPIEQVLVYNADAVSEMGSERIRFDVASMLPEMMTNKIRRPSTSRNYSDNSAFSVKNAKNIQYFERMISNNQESRINYLPNVAASWANMQSDEFNINGAYDFTIQLPPVPKSGTYELRYGISANNTRGMAQVYFGTNKNALPAAGIPLDLRVGGTKRHVDGTPSNLWEEDVDNDEAANQEIDKKMRNKGYMKAPATYLLYPGNFSVKNSLREVNYGGDRVVRCILLRQNMKAGELYYVRFKDVLGKDDSQFFFDYMELCPKTVYDNPNTPEDKW